MNRYSLRDDQWERINRRSDDFASARAVRASSGVVCKRARWARIFGNQLNLRFLEKTAPLLAHSVDYDVSDDRVDFYCSYGRCTKHEEKIEETVRAYQQGLAKQGGFLESRFLAHTPVQCRNRPGSTHRAQPLSRSFKFGPASLPL